MPQEIKPEPLPQNVESLSVIKEAVSRREQLSLLRERLQQIVFSENAAALLEKLRAAAEKKGLETDLSWYLLSPDFKPEFLLAEPQSVVTFDIETTEDEDHNPIFALAITIDHEGGVKKWVAGQENELVDYLCSHELVLSYNGLHFDLAVISQATSKYKMQELFNKSLDIAVLAQSISPMQSRELRLWTVAMNTTQTYLPKLPWASAKTSGAENIPQVLKEGNEEDLMLIWQHCFDDVAETRKIYAFFNPSLLALTYYFQSLLEKAFQSVKKTCLITYWWLEFAEDVDEDEDEPAAHQEELKKDRVEFPYLDFQELLAEFALNNSEPKTYTKSNPESRSPNSRRSPDLRHAEDIDDSDDADVPPIKFSEDVD
jgi:hypothetical protein